MNSAPSRMKMGTVSPTAATATMTVSQRTRIRAETRNPLNWLPITPHRPSASVVLRVRWLNDGEPADPQYHRQQRPIEGDQQPVQRIAGLRPNAPTDQRHHQDGR